MCSVCHDVSEQRLFLPDGVFKGDGNEPVIDKCCINKEEDMVVTSVLLKRGRSESNSTANSSETENQNNNDSPAEKTTGRLDCHECHHPISFLWRYGYNKRCDSGDADEVVTRPFEGYVSQGKLPTNVEELAPISYKDLFVPDEKNKDGVLYRL